MIRGRARLVAPRRAWFLRLGSSPARAVPRPPGRASSMVSMSPVGRRTIRGRKRGVLHRLLGLSALLALVLLVMPFDWLGVTTIGEGDVTGVEGGELDRETGGDAPSVHADDHDGGHRQEHHHHLVGEEVAIWMMRRFSRKRLQGHVRSAMDDDAHAEDEEEEEKEDMDASLTSSSTKANERSDVSEASSEMSNERDTARWAVSSAFSKERAAGETVRDGDGVHEMMRDMDETAGESVRVRKKRGRKLKPVPPDEPIVTFPPVDGEDEGAGDERGGGVEALSGSSPAFEEGGGDAPPAPPSPPRPSTLIQMPFDAMLTVNVSGHFSDIKHRALEVHKRAKDEKARRLLAVGRAEVLVKQAYRSTKFATDASDRDGVKLAEGVLPAKRIKSNIRWGDEFVRMVQDWAKHGGRSGDMPWAPLINDYFDGLAQEESGVSGGDGEGTAGGSGGEHEGTASADRSKRKFTDKELMQWALDRLNEVMVEEKRARQAAEVVEKNAVSHSQKAAANALTAMKARSAKIASSGRLRLDLRPPAPVWYVGSKGGVYADGLVPQQATDQGEDEKWRGELRAVAHALLKGINIKLDPDGEAINNVFATEDNFHVSHAGKRADDPTTLPIANVEMTAFERQYLPVNGKPPDQVASCALVGNARSMLTEERGDEIDSHEVVMRLNQAPTVNFEKYVGSKTTHRLVNNKWGAAYKANEKLAMEPGVTMVFSRTDWLSYLRIAKVLGARDSEVKMRLLSRETVNYAGDLLRKMKGRVDLVRGLPYPGKGSPSSGWIGVWFLMQFCDKVSVYGMGDSIAAVDGVATAWHYFENRHFGNSREFSIDPHHSFKLEADILQVMDEGGLLLHRRLVVNETAARGLEDAEAWPSAPFDTIAEDSRAVRQFKISQQVAAAMGTGQSGAAALEDMRRGGAGRAGQMLAGGRANPAALSKLPPQVLARMQRGGATVEQRMQAQALNAIAQRQMRRQRAGRIGRIGGGT